ncbi:MAG: hypothetical protein P8M18_12255 [Woeseiaceae bacterium]|nr:hypothetical protein [Woeseiaceae bacterium]
MIRLKSGVILFALLLLTTPSIADDANVQSIDAIIDAYYDVISGPKGHRYDAARDLYLHAPQAIITRTSEDGDLQRHDFATEQAMVAEPYLEGFFEVEIGRLTQRYSNLAHVWSTFEIRNTPEGETVSRGVNSISLHRYKDRWWISSWSTQPEGEEPLPEEYLDR